MPLPAALTPLRHPAFRLLWTANLVSNTGMWMQNTGAGWLMTSLAPSPVMVSLVQVASLLPVFLLALPAGAAADIVDRRAYLITAQGWIALMGAALALLTLGGAIGPWGLLFFTFAIGAGSAMNFPAWAATTPELVPRPDIPQAVVLNGIGFNLTRAVGPALGGFTVAAAGPEATFALNAICFAAVMLALFAWRRERAAATLPKEHFLSAMRAGVGYVRASPVMRATIIRGTGFFFFGAAVWGLLPLLVRQQLGLGPEAFGLMLGAMGAGAVGAGFLLPALRTRLGLGRTVLAAAALACVSLVLLGLSWHWAPAILAMLLYGVSWITGASTLQASAQLASASWVRARSIGIYQVFTFGALAAGTTAAGFAGQVLGLPLTLAAAGVLCLLTALLVRRLSIDLRPATSFTGTATVPQPAPAASELADLLPRTSGRVLETVKFRIDPADRAAFLAAMAECRQVRLRSGAIAWRLYEDVAQPESWVELWAMESWTAHLREEGRMTEWDRATLARAAGFHRGENPPEAARYLNVQPNVHGPGG
jgi:MFS family permease